MNKILLLVTLFAFAIVAVPFGIAQTGTKKMDTTAHVCAKCDMASMKAGKCPCGSETSMMKGRVAHVCSHCNTSSKKAGNCSKCKMAMKKSFVTYSCDHCKMSAGKAGNCKMCKMPMKKHVVPMM